MIDTAAKRSASSRFALSGYGTRVPSGTTSASERGYTLGGYTIVGSGSAATQSLEFNSQTGNTTIAKLFALGSDTIVASVTAAEKTNDKNRFVAIFTNVAAGRYRLNGFVGTTGGFANEIFTLTLTTATFYPESENPSSTTSAQFVSRAI